MTKFPLLRQILFLAFAAATVAPALAAPPPPPPPRMLAIPPFPSAFQPTSLHIHDPLWLGHHLVFVRMVLPQSRPIEVRGYANGALIFVPLPPLEAGVYDVEYYDLQQVGYADEPRLSMRFFVSAKGPVDVIEYFNATLGHYFVTSEIAEVRKLDAPGSGWLRTGESFRALPSDEIPSFGRPVCRYYGLPSAGIDSHFFSASAEECERVAGNWPDKWVLETPAVFGALADTYPFTCEDTMQRLYRLYNNRPDANHRYTVSTAIRDAMLAKGWILEAAPLDGAYEPSYSMCVLP